MREQCPNCHFILTRCVCNFVAKIENQIQIIVIRYPKEALHPFNTINLAKLNFQKIKVFDYEFIDENIEFENLLKNFKFPLLLFPSDHSLPLKKDVLNQNKFDCLIIIDGTWKKAKKIFFQSTKLKKLNQFHLENKIDGKYLIRKSNFNGGISSIEAIVESLKILEADLDLSSALNSFHFMNESQIKFKIN